MKITPQVCKCTTKHKLAYCFTSNCPTHGKSLDVIDFIMKKENITKHEAILKAQDFIGLPTEPKPKPQPKPEPKPELPQEQKIAILTEAFKHFARSLNAKPEKAIQYLATRKLDYKKLAIGYDTGTQHKTKEITAEQKQLYLQTSLIKPDKFDRENHCSYCKSRNKKPYYAKRNTHT